MLIQALLTLRFALVTDIYQSHGACKNICVSDYAFAIVQGNACWCSNYAPSKSDSSCNEDCPGYPLEKCGNSKAGAYAYLPLVIEPSGTAGASTKATVSPTSVPPPPPPLPPTISTVTEEKEGSVETVTIVRPPRTPSVSCSSSVLLRVPPLL